MTRDRWQKIRVLHDIRGGGSTMLREGQEVWGRYTEPPPGCGGFKGWIVRPWDSDPLELALEEGRDAVREEGRT